MTDEQRKALLALADRIEAAEAWEQYDLLIEAFGRCYPEHYMPGRSGFGPLRWERFNRMLAAKAYESAALMLVPDEWVIASFEWWPMTKRTSVTMREVRENDFGIGYDESCGDARSSAHTPALAIAAAAIRARAAQ